VRGSREWQCDEAARARLAMQAMQTMQAVQARAARIWPGACLHLDLPRRANWFTAHPAPHTMSTSSTLLSTFRSATNASLRLRAPLNKRFFSPSASNMVIKTYFDCSWTGPEVTVDQKGNVTNVGSVKGTPAPPATPMPAPNR
jgi:hypothetical protein